MIAKFDLRVIVAEVPVAGCAAAIEYSTALFDAARMERMAGHLGVLLGAVAADPGRPVSGLAVLTAGEREQLAAVGRGRRCRRCRGRAGCMSWSRRGRRRCPDAVAVVCGGAVS